MAHTNAPLYTWNGDIGATSKIVDVTNLSTWFQSFDCRLKCLASAASDDNLINTFSISHSKNLVFNRTVFVAVSYTHLDVYKRQGCSLPKVE